LFLVFHLSCTMKFHIKNLEHLNTLTEYNGSLLPCHHLTLLPTHGDTSEYQCKFRWHGKSWCMEQKKWALKLPSVNCVMSIFSLSPNFLFFCIVHLSFLHIRLYPLAIHFTLDCTLWQFTSHLHNSFVWDIFLFLPRYWYLSTDVLCAVLVFPYTFCALPT
jgi:hypothetical protein